MLHYDAILFDVDGTLIDSAPGILHTLEEVFQKMGVDVTGVNLRRYLARRCARASASTSPSWTRSSRPPAFTAKATR